MSKATASFSSTTSKASGFQEYISSTSTAGGGDTSPNFVSPELHRQGGGTDLTNLANKKTVMGVQIVSPLDGNTAATASITGILDDNTIPAALHGETITLIDNAESPVTKTYKFMNSSTTNGAIDGGDGYIHIAIQGEDTKEGLVDNIEQAVEHANGHNGSISVSRSGAVLTLTQGTIGTGGNTTITFSGGINTSTEVSKTDFTGGLDQYIDAKVEGSIDGTTWFPVHTLSTTIDPTAVATSLFVADLTDTYIPQLRISINTEGKAVGGTGTVKILYAGKTVT